MSERDVTESPLLEIIPAETSAIQKKGNRKESGQIPTPVRKASRAENHQTISGVSQRQWKKRFGYNSNGSAPIINVALKTPESVFYVNRITQRVEEMDIESMLTLVKEHYGEDTEYLEVQPPEDDKYGNIEYKLKLIKTEERRLQELECQMLRRLDEGVDTCFYHIGLEDDGNPLGLIEEEFFLSLKVLAHVATKNECSFQLDRVFNGEMGFIAFVKIKQKPRSVVRADIRIQLMGEESSGKTTLIKTIYYKEPTLSRQTATTQIQQQYLCFDSNGKLLSRFPFTVLGIEGEIELATKIISFVDTGSKSRDRKYFVQSYCSRLPNYGLLVISAARGFSDSDKLKIRDAASIGMVFFIVITAIDAVPCSVLGNIVCAIKSFINSAYPTKSTQTMYILPQVARVFTESFLRGDFFPIFLVSSKDMTNIKLLTKFLSQLPDNKQEQRQKNNESVKGRVQAKSELTELTIYNSFDKSTINIDKNNENIIFQGTVVQGNLKIGQKLLIGPDLTIEQSDFISTQGHFRWVKVQELMVVKTGVELVQTSQICSARVSMGLRDKAQFEIRKGQVLVDAKLIPRAAFEFLAELTLFDSVTKDVIIKTGFQPVVSFQSIRQICKIMVTKEDLEGRGYRPLARRKSLQREMNPASQQVNVGLLLPLGNIKAFKSSNQGDKMIEDKALVFSKNLNKKFLRRTKSIEKFSELIDNDCDSCTNTSQNIELAKNNVPVIIIKQNQSVKVSSDLSSPFPSLNKYQKESKNYLRMRFCYRPERIQVGQVFYIDEVLLKAVGVITKVFY